MSATQHPAEQERRVAEELWLTYFNAYLLKQGVISSQEFARMTELIATRSRKKPPLRKEAK